MWGKKKRAKAHALELAYVQRLQEIDETNQSAVTRGLTHENLKRGQTEYLGEVTVEITRATWFLLQHWEC